MEAASQLERDRNEDVRFSIARLQELRRMREQASSPTPKMLAVVAFVALGLALALAATLTLLFAKRDTGSAEVADLALPSSPTEPRSYSVLIGVALCLTACTLNALGMNLQRLGQTKASPSLNVAGVALQAACGIVDITSYSFAPQSLLAPLSSLTLVLNLLFAPLMHEGDKLTVVDMSATMLVFAGIAVALSYGSDVTGDRTPGEILELATQPRFLVYAACQTILLVVLLSIIWEKERRERAAKELLGGDGSSDRDDTHAGGEASPSNRLSSPSSPKLRGEAADSGDGGGLQSKAAVCYPVAAGILAGASVFGAKTLTELVGAGGVDVRVIAAIVVFTLAAVLSQVYTLNRGLGFHSPLFVVPIFIATLVLTNICGGAIFFDEFKQFTREQWRMYPCGALLVVVGVLLLATRAMGAEKRQRRRARTISEVAVGSISISSEVRSTLRQRGSYKGTLKRSTSHDIPRVGVEGLAGCLEMTGLEEGGGNNSR